MCTHFPNPYSNNPFMSDAVSYPRNRFKDEYYPRSNKDEPLFVKENGEPKYAQDREGNEFYPTFDGEDVVLKTSKGFRYTKDASKTEKYPEDSYGNQKPFFDENCHVVYAKRKDGTEIYPKDNNLIEQKYDRYAKNAYGNIVYPLDAKGQPQYERDPTTHSEVYAFHPTTGNLVIGKNRDGDQVY
ncbi:hypothetical protein AVEN_168965-1, partial [Araneus ventricosus]